MDTAALLWPDSERDEQRSRRADQPSWGMLRHHRVLVIVGVGSLMLFLRAVLPGARSESPRQAPSFRASISAAIVEEDFTPLNYTLLGNGYCSRGFYAGLLTSEASDLATCAEKCNSETRCKFFSFIRGQTCSRFDSAAGSCALYTIDVLAAAHRTYAKQGSVSTTPVIASSTEALEATSASRSENQTSPVTTAATAATARGARGPGTREPTASTTVKAVPTLTRKEKAPATPTAELAASANATPAAANGTPTVANATQVAAANATPETTATARPAAANATRVASANAKQAASANATPASTANATPAAANSTTPAASKPASVATKANSAADGASTAKTGEGTVVGAMVSEEEAAANVADAMDAEETTVTDTKNETTASVTPVVVSQTSTTTTNTSTTPTTTTQTSTRGELYCWLLARAKTYEVELVQASFAQKQGIFGCDAYEVMADYAFHLGKGVPMILIGNVTSPPAWWGSIANGPVFVRAWDKLLGKGTYMQYRWIVKVDPDTVFLPERLRQHLWKMPSDQHIWVRNWNAKFGLLGPIEIFTVLAIEEYSKRKRECIAKHDVAAQGEDGFFGTCLNDILKVGSYTDFGVADFSGNFEHCRWANGAPAMHPFKDPNTFRQCLNACISAR